MQRVQRLCPEIQEFLAMIRLEEGFLRKSQVLGKDREPKSQHEALQVQLKKAMQAFELQNARCSRAKAWQTFTRLVAANASAPLPCKGATKSSTPLRPPEHFIPSHVTIEGARQYQVLLIREHLCDTVTLGIVELAFRGSAGRGGEMRGQKLVTTSLPALLCTTLHIVLMTPANQGKNWWASCRSESLVIDPHKESGVVLCELSPAAYVLKDSSGLFVEVQINQDAHQAMKNITGTGLQPQVNQEAPASIYTVDGFSNSQAGRRRISEYLEVCGQLYRDLTQKNLADENGYIRLKSHGAMRWADIVARCPDYFVTMLLTKKISGGKSSSLTAAQFSRAVWQKYNEIAPTKRNGTEKFLNFLKDVDDVAPKSLPVSIG